MEEECLFVVMEMYITLVVVVALFCEYTKSTQLYEIQWVGFMVYVLLNKDIKHRGDFFRKYLLK